MPSAIVKFSDSPLQFTNDAFEKLVISGGKRIDDVVSHVLEACNQDIVAGGRIKELPLLTEHTLTAIRHGTLVRYRCMVQDMREPEYFQSVYSTIDESKSGEERLHCNLWRETLELSEGHEYCDEGPRHETSERHVFVGSSIPAETSWSRQYYIPNATAGMNTMTQADDQTPIAQCVLRVYRSSDNIKLNDVIDFVGIYYPVEGSAEVGSTDSTRTEASKPKPLPCLHVFHFEKLVHHHPDITLPNGTREEHLERGQLIRALNGDVLGFRARLIDILKETMFKGDDLASEYFLCHLMSSIYARDMSTAVGQFALNIFNARGDDFGADWTDTKLKALLEQLLTQVAYLPLSLATLNHGSLVSKKCYETDRLMSGRLQLPKGTAMIIDETKLDAGRLDTQGVKNMAALRNMIKYQKVDYDFGFNTCEFSTDLRVLIISEGPSILPSDFALPLRSKQAESPTTPPSDLSLILGDRAFVEAARVYLALAPTLAFTIDEAIQTRIQEDFVAMRRESNGEITGDHLHRLLTVARMLSLSSGDSRLRLEVWEKAKRMEAERLDRLKK